MVLLMKVPGDRLYCIFEQHLFNALVENESTEEFLAYVVKEYLEEIRSMGTLIPEHARSIEDDLREEVLEMLRKKIYGHYNLAEYRKTKAPAVKEERQIKTPTQRRRSS
jgi:hypothetical protein